MSNSKVIKNYSKPVFLEIFSSETSKKVLNLIVNNEKIDFNSLKLKKIQKRNFRNYQRL